MVHTFIYNLKLVKLNNSPWYATFVVPSIANFLSAGNTGYIRKRKSRLGGIEKLHVFVSIQ